MTKNLVHYFHNTQFSKKWDFRKFVILKHITLTKHETLYFVNVEYKEYKIWIKIHGQTHAPCFWVSVVCK